MNEDRSKPLVAWEVRLHHRTVPWRNVFRFVARWALRIAALAVVIVLLRRTGSTLAPFVLGVLLAYLLLPVVQRLDRWLPRWASIVVVYLAVLALLGFGVMFVVPPVVDQTSQVVNSIPGWIAQTDQFVNQQVAAFQRTASPPVQAQVVRLVQTLQDTFERNVLLYVQRLGALAFSSVLTLLQTITFVIGFLVIPIFLFFVLLSTPRLPRAMDRLLHPAIRPDVWNMWRIADHVLGTYVRSQLILGVIVGVATYAALWSLRFVGIDVPYAVLLAVVAGIGELIPIVGPIISAVPAMIAVSGGGIGPILTVALVYFVIQQLESQILVPRIVGSTLRLNPALLLVLLVVAASAGGLLLMIAAAPLAAVSRDIYRYGQRRLAEPPLPPALAMEGLLPDRQAARAAQQEQTAPS